MTVTPDDVALIINKVYRKMCDCPGNIAMLNPDSTIECPTCSVAYKLIKEECRAEKK